MSEAPFSQVYAALLADQPPHILRMVEVREARIGRILEGIAARERERIDLEGVAKSLEAGSRKWGSVLRRRDWIDRMNAEMLGMVGRIEREILAAMGYLTPRGAKVRDAEELAGGAPPEGWSPQGPGVPEFGRGIAASGPADRMLDDLDDFTRERILATRRRVAVEEVEESFAPTEAQMRAALRNGNGNGAA